MELKCHYIDQFKMFSDRYHYYNSECLILLDEITKIDQDIKFHNTEIIKHQKKRIEYNRKCVKYTKLLLSHELFEKEKQTYFDNIVKYRIEMGKHYVEKRSNENQIEILTKKRNDLESRMQKLKKNAENFFIEMNRIKFIINNNFFN